MMKCLGQLACRLQCYLNKTRTVDFLAPLAIRLYLVPIFWMAGLRKWTHMDSTIAWFGKCDWDALGPYPSAPSLL